MDGLDDIVEEFLVESHENLDQLDADLVALEQAPNSRDRLSSIFRTIHTIKGTSGFLAFNRLEEVTHVGGTCCPAAEAPAPVVPVQDDLREEAAVTAQHTEEPADAVVIVVRLHGEAVSFLVDSIADVVDVDADDFEAPPDNLEGHARDLIRGAYKLDGQLLLALDVQKAVSA